MLILVKIQELMEEGHPYVLMRVALKGFVQLGLNRGALLVLGATVDVMTAVVSLIFGLPVLLALIVAMRVVANLIQVKRMSVPHSFYT